MYINTWFSRAAVLTVITALLIIGPQESRAQDVQSRFDKGNTLLESGRHQEAIECFDKAEELAPSMKR